MTEIEIKAHVEDRAALEQKLNTFAKYEGSVTRDDTYYKKDGISIRIRKETKEVTEQKSDYLLTYKRKEQRTDSTGTTIEVNDEKECEISTPEPLVAFLEDTGYTISLKKHKEVKDWCLDLPDVLKKHSLQSTKSFSYKATFELCKVPPLGDFLEIEILSPTSEENIVNALHKELEELLQKAGIPKSKVEKKYYSELMANLKK